MGPIREFLIRNFLVLGLATVIPLGFLIPYWGTVLAQWQLGPVTLTSTAVTVIFLISGISLGSLKECLELKALVAAMLVILALTPALAAPVLALRSFGLMDPHLVHGMAIFCVVPTTLSSGVVMVTQSHGNTALAILITMVANTAGVITMPVSAHLIFKLHADVNAWPIFADLLLTMCLPLLIGCLLQRAVPGVQEFAKANKTLLTLTNNCCILFCVWMAASSAHEEIVATHVEVLCLLVLIGVLLHLVKLTVTVLVDLVCAFPARERRTLILMCSQKSLPVAISLIAALPASLQRYAGLMALPCIIGHASQLFIDAVLVRRWAEQPIEDAKLPLYEAEESVESTVSENKRQ